ncbi:hypothetical protein PNEG_02460 [Pneumocystis murina B123]|uniref:Uncharacterized protein n=1 Tax=Pneumocystis murina (strain B123) TaxID=1069680 RepID=M7NPC9_PNEMU|nr:hypothetical protein PNEG_02460 [Pneumocystis murina B123]EMR09117.1 hypothetical protein PNEG_02460 [Pneumocystis murina B123]
MVAPVIFIIFVPIFVAIIVLFFIHQLRTRKILEEDHDIDKSRFSVVQLYKSIFFCFRKKSPKKNIDRQDFEGSSLNDIIPDIYLPPIIFSSQDLNLFARTFHSDTNDTRYHTGVSVLSKT